MKAHVTSEQIVDSQEFYELLQQYRHAIMTEPASVSDAFDAVKQWVRTNYIQKQSCAITSNHKLSTPVYKHLNGVESWESADKDTRIAFYGAMKGRAYGREPTLDAWNWFLIGRAGRPADETSRDDARDAARYRYLRERQAFDRLAARKRVPSPIENGREPYRTMFGDELDQEIDACIGSPLEPFRNQANSTSSGLLAATPMPRGNLPNSLGTGGAGLHPAASSFEEDVEPDLTCESYIEDPHSRFCDRCGYPEREHKRTGSRENGDG